MIGLLVVSTGYIDMKPDPVTEAETNTTGVPVVNATETSAIDGKEIENAIFELVNEVRREYGREPFVHSERVRLIARLHSKDMAKRGFFDHNNPDGQGSRERHDEYGGCDDTNENILIWKNLPENNSREIAEGVVAGWVNSSGHNNTQLSSYYHVSGVGVYVTENRTLFATQNFCREHPNA
jgi:uncharacterized protein YkwD